MPREINARNKKDLRIVVAMGDFLYHLNIKSALQTINDCEDTLKEFCDYCDRLPSDCDCDCDYDRRDYSDIDMTDYFEDR
jgi:hypothetical protein